MLYFLNPDEKGSCSDTFQNLIMETSSSKDSKTKKFINDRIICNVNCFMWMSTLAQFDKCLERLSQLNYVAKNVIDNRIPVAMNINHKVSVCFLSNIY